ncbi:aspartate-semialdehyde dehydrogenase [Desulfoplanes formicivorans]|uniref:Aspartate-semialdehyde dehydrogenase n=1 Tax=Desulfoplanes formicivorans TaxID=1592317 RepID=A0A194ADS6_9BACT|nr:aspartate-semialdehyde dehydrogenase [Desulfoplanes formicivorans]GAU07355.1 aspartate-semialdehyde dehydrogenase [Desulfoplanes formicivorans]
MKTDEYVVGLVGGTGILDQEIVAVLEEREFPCSQMVAFVDSDGDRADLTFRDEDVPVEFLREDGFEGVDLVFFVGDNDLTAKWIGDAVKAGCAIVDCSTDRDEDSLAPVIASGVNDEALAGKRMAASPGATSLQLAAVLKPLHDTFAIKRVVVSTYQPVSSQGHPGIEELESQLRHLLNYQEAQSEVFPYQIAFNCLPQIGVLHEDEYTSQETSLIRETMQILGDEALRITATACLVPTLFGNGLSVNMETSQAISPRDARAILSQIDGITVFDNPAEEMYPMPLIVSGHDDVFVGRIRKDASVEHGLNLWIVGDNIRNQAVNAVRIGEGLREKGLGVSN